MCIICVLIDKERLTSSEAYKAAGGGEYTVEPEHAWDLIEKIEVLRKEEEKEAAEHASDDDYTAGD